MPEYEQLAVAGAPPFELGLVLPQAASPAAASASVAVKAIRRMRSVQLSGARCPVARSSYFSRKPTACTNPIIRPVQAVGQRGSEVVGRLALDVDRRGVLSTDCDLVVEEVRNVHPHPDAAMGCRVPRHRDVTVNG